MLSPRRLTVARLRGRALALVATLFRGVAFAEDDAVDPYGRLRAELPARVASAFSPQPCAATESALDRESYEELNELHGLAVLDRPDGWSVEARIGGRPFHCFTAIRVDERGLSPVASDFEPSGTAIEPTEILDHFGAGKTVNRLWFVHRAAAGDFPVTVVFTADGFMVVGGARPPLLFGTTLRTGIIGQPFGDGDYQQHVEDVVIRALTPDSLQLTYLVESEAAVAAVEAVLRWDAERDAPSLEFRAALSARIPGRLGFVGGNALRGPTLHGLLDECGDPPPKGGIAAFHDVRSALVALPDGRVVHDLLVPPIAPRTVTRTRLVGALPPGGRLILDQSQHVPAARYFSRHPGVAYHDRADVVITLVRAPSAGVSVERAQVAADLGSANPEANETVNVYLATEVPRGGNVEVGFSVDVAAEDFAATPEQLTAGVVFVDSGPDGDDRLVLVGLDDALAPSGPAQPLTGPSIVGPRRASASADGRWVTFDAEDSAGRARRGIYLLDRLGGDVRRLTVDPGSDVSFDRAPSLDGGGQRVAFVTNRGGSATQAVVAEVDEGLGCGRGDSLGCASDVALDVTGERLARVCEGAVTVQSLDGSLMTVVSAHLGARDVSFSPDGSKLVFASDSGVWISDLDAGSEWRVTTDGESPAWVGSRAVLVERVEDGEADLFAIDLETAAARRITPADGRDARDPWFVGTPP